MNTRWLGSSAGWRRIKARRASAMSGRSCSAMVINADPANAPLGKAIGLRRQRVEVRPIELFEERPAGDTEAPDRAFVIELPEQLADRRIEFSQTVLIPGTNTSIRIGG
jgi:hypothetical protein